MLYQKWDEWFHFIATFEGAVVYAHDLQWQADLMIKRDRDRIKMQAKGETEAESVSREPCFNK